MWASTKASSVIEWLRRYSTQLITSGNADGDERDQQRPARGDGPDGTDFGDRRAELGGVVAAALGRAARRSLGRLDGAHGLLRMLRLRRG